MKKQKQKTKNKKKNKEKRKTKGKKKKAKVIFYISFLRYSPFQGSSVKIFLTQNKFSFLYGTLSSVYGRRNQNLEASSETSFVTV